MADPRFRLFRHHVVIVTWLSSYQKMDLRTYYLSLKFHCDCLNVLEVTEGGMERSKKARSE